MDMDSLNQQLKAAQAQFQKLDLVGQVSRPLADAQRAGSAQASASWKMYTAALDSACAQEQRAYAVKMMSLGVFTGSLFLLSRARLRYSTRNMVFFYIGCSFAVQCPKNLNPF